MKIINCTQHKINLNDGTVYCPCGSVARVSEKYIDTDPLVDYCHGGIDDQEHENYCGCDHPYENILTPIFITQYNNLEGLPSPKTDTFYIVSSIALSAAKALGRTDCIAPATGHYKTVRNDLGHILSVPGFVK